MRSLVLGAWSLVLSRPWSLVLASAIVLALRKPWALHTPQFWAEDGEIFMNQADQSGLLAFVTPYNGYLHLLPRVIAWLAVQVADVAWWPALYNYFAFAITVALFVRLASSRVQLPAKPWLMLAFALIPSSGEVLLNVTNLQWQAAFFLLLHLFTTPADTRRQRLGDLAIIALVGLNGPFALLFLPLFAWRAWRDFRAPGVPPGGITHRAARDSILALAVLTACAAIQAYFVSQAPLPLGENVRPFAPVTLLAVIGNRLLIWPLLGPDAARAVPQWLAATATVPLLLFVGWTLRRAPDRPIRTTFVAVILLVTAAGLYRARADTWDFHDTTAGDRYLHIPRVLLAWLLILEWHAAPRFVALLARAACALGFLTNFPHLKFPTPPDYRWAENCDPIRRGTPAAIHTLPEGYWIDYRGRTK